MSVEASDYTVAGNQPLHHSRILWDFLTGTTTTTGSVVNPEYAVNDYTHQRADIDSTSANAQWQIELSEPATFDTVIIAAHTLGSSGATVRVFTSPSLVDPFVGHGVLFAPTDDGAIAIMLNDGSGNPITAQKVRLNFPSGATTPASVGIIRAGVALQMPKPLPFSAQPIGLRTVKDVRHVDSEAGQWIGRYVERSRQEAGIGWSGLDADWYRSDFQPFAATLPERPFALIQNAVSMPESVAWCFTNASPMPSYSAGRKKMSIGLDLVGFAG